MKKYITIFIALIVGIINISFAQSDDEPEYEEFIKNFKKDYFTLEMLFQVVADFQPERTFIGNNGFTLSNMRLRLLGNLDENFNYFFQASFIVSPLLLDASIGYKFSDAFRLNAGQFKAPFSKEFLTYAANIDFVNRARATALLSPRRDIGLELSGKFASNLIEYKAGIFNGNGPNNVFNDNNSFLYVARIAASPHTDNNRYEFGLNAGYSNNSNQGVLTKSFNGKKTFLGGDIRAEIHNFLFSTEIVMNKLDGKIDSLESNKEPYGYHVTLGYKPFQKHQFLLRYENLTTDGIIEDSDLYILGYNFWPTSATEIQFNYIINSENTDFKNHLYLINFQISI